MSLQDDMESKQSWTQAEIDALRSKHKRIHFDHFQGVVSTPTHPKDDPNWEYIGVGRWRRKVPDGR